MPPEQTHSIYMGAPIPLTRLANGAITNALAHEHLRKTSYLEPQADRVAPGVTVFGGDSFLNLTLIEGADGLIVYDTGENSEDGARFLEKIRTISQKPIVAVIYSHSHYVQGTAALIGNAKDVKIIGHPRVNANVAAGGVGSTFAETAPLQLSRALQQFNVFAPKDGPDAAAGANINLGSSAFLPVNTPVEDGQQLTIAGIEFQFFTRFGSDSDDALTVYLPQIGVVLNNFLWPFVPNIYTLRAAKYRDPREWRDGLKVIRALEPSVLVNTHARAIRGREAIAEVLDAVIDGLNAILDQTLRGILRGLGPDELRTFVELPDHLKKVPHLAEIYGEVSHFGPYLFNHALGWFDGDAGTINPLSPNEQAERLVGSMGGVEAVLSRARTAFAAKEYAWAAQLVGYLYRLDPSDPTVRLLKADILQQMGRITPAHTIRSWYISQARALRGEVVIPRLYFPDASILALANPTDSLNEYRIRVDPKRSGDLDLVVTIAITDRAARHAWHLRRGVVEFITDPVTYSRGTDLEIATDFDNWLQFFSFKRSLADFLERATIITGTMSDALRFFEAFDYLSPQDNTVL
jgi:alkyl sulfatase BDS1-like metallo-beta-lactamase superfamily hydrolase